MDFLFIVPGANCSNRSAWSRIHSIPAFVTSGKKKNLRKPNKNKKKIKKMVTRISTMETYQKSIHSF